MTFDERERQTAEITFNLEESALTALTNAAKDANMDVGQYVGNSIQIYRTLREETKTGSKVYIGKNNEVRKEVIVK